MAFQISVSNARSGALISLQVSGDMTIGLLKVVVSTEMSVPAENMTLSFQGVVLADDAKTLRDCSITEHQVIQVSSGSGLSGAAVTNTSAQVSASASGSSSSSSLSDSTETLVDPSLRMDMLPGNLDPRRFHDIVRLNPQLLAEIEYTNSELAQAMREDDFSKTRGLLIQYQMSSYQRKRKQAAEDQKLNDNPFDADAQNVIQERIRLENVARNRELAMQHHPESFSRVLSKFVAWRILLLHD